MTVFNVIIILVNLVSAPVKKLKKWFNNNTAQSSTSWVSKSENVRLKISKKVASEEKMCRDGYRIRGSKSDLRLYHSVYIYVYRYKYLMINSPLIMNILWNNRYTYYLCILIEAWQSKRKVNSLFNDIFVLIKMFAFPLVGLKTPCLPVWHFSNVSIINFTFTFYQAETHFCLLKAVCVLLWI